MFENLRERFQVVQQDFTTGFKTLGDKSKDTKMKRRLRSQESFSDFIAGLKILSRYEESWFMLHKKTKDCAQASEAVYREIVMLSAHWEKRKTALTQLQEQLKSLPVFITELNTITTNIAHLEGEFEEMESRLVYLETLHCQCEQQTLKQHHITQLEVYKKKKRKEMEAIEGKLNFEHAQKVSELELAMQKKLRERQKVYEEAFKQDMQQYLTMGSLQYREPTGSDVCALDQMTVTNMLDQKALDEFLNSISDDSVTGSSLTSSLDLNSCSSGSLRSQTNTVLSTNSQLSSHDTEWQQEEDGASEIEDNLLQSDEEVIQPDMLLVDLQDVDTVRGSDESDSVEDLPSVQLRNQTPYS